MRTQCLSWAVLTSLLTSGACSLAGYRDDADAEVSAILADGAARVLGDRREWVVQPVPPESPAESPAASPADATPASRPGATKDVPTPALVQVFDLTRALRTAVSGNRDLLSRKESLYQQGLAYSLTRFDFGPQFTSAVNYLWSAGESGVDQQDTTAQLGMSQILPTGGTLSLSSSAGAAWPYGAGSAGDGYQTSLGASLRQPLLRGAGYDMSHEALTQAERGLVYAIRDFELFRENFSIGVARTFYELVSQRLTLANEDANYEGAVFDRKKAEALHQVDRNTEQEVFRARRREIEAKSQLINARANYDRAIDEFKILLGLPTTSLIDVAESEPLYERVRIEEASAVAAARHNRLDVITQRQQVEDAERALRIAENGLLPNLDLVANYGLAGSGTTLAGAGADQWNSSVGLSFEVPLQRKPQRNNYRSSLIAMEQTRRNHALRLDQLDLEIRDALRNLKSLEEQIQLQEEQIVQERGAVTVTEIRYQSGKLDNRDLLEARQALVNAQNALIRLKVEHFIARLALLRDMGLFFVDDQGMWQRGSKP